MPEKVFRSHWPARIEAAAWGTGRAPQRMWVKVSSAVAIVLPDGVFMTMTPRSVAASTSTLSTPTPARPDDLQERRGGDDLGRDLGLRAHGDRVDVLHQLEQLRRRRAVGLDDFEAGLLPQPGDPLR